MKIAIHRSEIKNAVAGFGRVVNGKTTLPALGCAMFECDADGARATVTDLDQSACYSFADARDTAFGRCLVPMTELRELAKGSGSETVEIGTCGEGVAIASCAGVNVVRQTIAALDPDDWPDQPHVATGAPAPAPGFLDTFRRLTPFASTDETRHVLCSVYIDIAPDKEHPATMVATDGRRISLWNSMNLPMKRSAIVPATKFLAWSALKDEAAIAIGTETREKKKVDTGLSLRCGPWTYNTRLIEGSYPNFRQVVPPQNDAPQATIRISEDDARTAARLLPALAPKTAGEPAIRLRASDKGGVVLVSTDAERKSSANLDRGSRWDGERMSVGVNPFFLLDALEAGFRDFALADDASPLASRDGRGGTHVLMPVRLGPDPDEPRKAVGHAAETVDPASATAEEPDSVESDAVREEEEPVNVQPQSAKGVCEKMSEEQPKTVEDTGTSGVDILLKIVADTRIKMREVAAGLADVAAAAKTAAKEGKAQAQDLEKARATLQKLQGITL